MSEETTITRMIDAKYGVTVDGRLVRVNQESGALTEIPDDEPLFLLRAKDSLAAAAIGRYAKDCGYEGCPQSHVDAVWAVVKKFRDYYRSHPETVREPS